MNIKTIITVAVIIALVGAGIVVARPFPNEGSFWNNMMGGLYNRMNGMMGSGNGYGGMMGSGMMGSGNGYGGMMGSGNGSYCGIGPDGVSNGTNPITIDEAKGSVEKYLDATGNNDLEIAEIIEFSNNFYAGIKEKSTGKYAFELLVDKYTGSVFPEMGPNMMWNTKYGHMNWSLPKTPALTPQQAVEKAQEYLDKAMPGTKVGDADAFYGYYTLEIKKDEKISGMLSVNSNTGQVWYHTWHGTFVRILEVG